MTDRPEAEPAPHKRNPLPWTADRDWIHDANESAVTLNLWSETAAFIAHACNSHARLVAENARMRAALESIVEWERTTKEDDVSHHAQFINAMGICAAIAREALEVKP